MFAACVSSVTTDLCKDGTEYKVCEVLGIKYLLDKTWYIDKTYKMILMSICRMMMVYEKSGYIWLSSMKSSVT